MISDDMALYAVAWLAEALTDEILDASDAGLGETIPGYGGRIAADRWRQRVRPIRMGADETAREAAPAISRDVDHPSEERAS